jgi:hypothetical protein
MRGMPTTGNDPRQRLNTERVSTSNNRRWAVPSFGGDDLVTMTRMTTPDEIGIDRGTRGRVGIVGCP